jgi:NTP pyrophosphatase (non-canonical NTP hydrolase)
MKDYIDAALSTKGGDFHGEQVGVMYFIQALRDFVDAAHHLDAIKKTLFYGKPLYKLGGHKFGGVNLSLITDDIKPDIIHGIIGGATETGEMVEALLRALEGMLMGEAVTLDETNLKEETGDQLWYLAILLAALGTDFTTEGKRNIAKLMVRFPAGFTDANALVRDLKAERALLESAVA